METLWPLFLWLRLQVLARTVSALSFAPPEMPSCASNCIATAIANSSCKGKGPNCLCIKEPIQMEAAACIMESCTVKEFLVATNLTMTSCDAPVRDRSRVCVVQSITLTALSTLFVIQRFSVKIFWSMPIWVDDYATFLSYLLCLAMMFLAVFGLVGHGLGQDIWTLSSADITAFSIYMYASGIAYIAAITTTKLSLLFFYLRIFPMKPVRRILWGTTIINAVYGIVFCLAIAFQCLPVSYYWNSWDGEHQGHCANMSAIAWSSAVLSIAIDIWMLIVPLLQLKSLNLDWKKKIGVGIMFSIGTFVTIISIVRLQSLIQFTRNIPNPTWDFVSLSMWSSIEANVGIICSCLPSLRLLLTRLFPKLLGTSQQYYSHHARRDEAGVSNTMSRVLGTRTHISKNASTSQQRNDSDGITCQRAYATEFGDSDETHLVSMRDLDQKSSRSDISLRTIT